LKELLCANENLPEKERFPLEKFILDQDDFDQKLRDAESEIKRECGELEKESQENQKAVQAVLNSFWLDMDQPSRKITV